MAETAETTEATIISLAWAGGRNFTQLAGLGIYNYKYTYISYLCICTRVSTSHAWANPHLFTCKAEARAQQGCTLDGSEPKNKIVGSRVTLGQEVTIPCIVDVLVTSSCFARLTMNGFTVKNVKSTGNYKPWIVHALTSKHESVLQLLRGVCRQLISQGCMQPATAKPVSFGLYSVQGLVWMILTSVAFLGSQVRNTAEWKGWNGWHCANPFKAALKKMEKIEYIYNLLYYFSTWDLLFYFCWWWFGFKQMFIYMFEWDHDIEPTCYPLCNKYNDFK